MIDKIFIPFSWYVASDKYRDVGAALGTLVSQCDKYIDECKARYKQYHPENLDKVPCYGQTIVAPKLQAAFMKKESKPHKCPVCAGNGKFMFPGKSIGYDSCEALEKECHGCDGKGWVVC